MKKVIILILFTILLTGCGTFNLDGFVMPDDLEFLMVVQTFDTPEKIANYMEDNFTYKLFRYANFSPYNLWKNREGDCNDFACFGTFVANYHGYETYQIKIWYKDASLTHRIGVYREDIYSFTDTVYYYYGFKTFKDIVEESGYHTGFRWRSYKVYDYENNLIEEGK